MGTSRLQSRQTTTTRTAWPWAEFSGHVVLAGWPNQISPHVPALEEATIFGHSLPRLRYEQVHVLLGHKNTPFTLPEGRYSAFSFKLLFACIVLDREIWRQPLTPAGALCRSC
jgi:hypothetical protein